MLCSTSEHPVRRGPAARLGRSRGGCWPTRVGLPASALRLRLGVGATPGFHATAWLRANRHSCRGDRRQGVWRETGPRPRASRDPRCSMRGHEGLRRLRDGLCREVGRQLGGWRVAVSWPEQKRAPQRRDGARMAERCGSVSPRGGPPGLGDRSSFEIRAQRDGSGAPVDQVSRLGGNVARPVVGLASLG